MGEKKHFVLAITKVLPDDIETDLNALTEKIIEVIKPLNTKLEASRIEPIAFGLKALIVRLIIPEEMEGGTQPVEDAIESLEEVQRVEVTMVTRI
ncbi:MAG: elongation factor 1-beta [Promethearchaeota archaeon]